MYDKAFYGKVYDLLVSQGQIRADVHKRNHFSLYFTEDEGAVREWRFCGDLGFGGKFWHNNGRHYVSYYIEDKTAKREKLANRLNAAIAELESEHAT